MPALFDTVLVQFDELCKWEAFPDCLMFNDNPVDMDSSRDVVQKLAVAPDFLDYPKSTWLIKLYNG